MTVNTSGTNSGTNSGTTSGTTGGTTAATTRAGTSSPGGSANRLGFRPFEERVRVLTPPTGSIDPLNRECLLPPGRSRLGLGRGGGGAIERLSFSASAALSRVKIRPNSCESL
ncbi:MAG TPA: hypothetical protein DCE39_05345 [Planctomycetaceae bacterium]|nr:hypothetical protein [Planctomycetaceae bacterium]